MLNTMKDDNHYYARYEAAFNATDLKLDRRQSFAHWFAESDHDDPITALADWKRLIR